MIKSKSIKKKREESTITSDRPKGGRARSNPLWHFSSLSTPSPRPFHTFDWINGLHCEVQHHFCRRCMPANPVEIIHILGIPTLLVHEVMWIALFSSEASSARSARHNLCKYWKLAVNKQSWDFYLQRNRGNKFLPFCVSLFFFFRLFRSSTSYPHTPTKSMRDR